MAVRPPLRPLRPTAGEHSFRAISRDCVTNLADMSAKGARVAQGTRRPMVAYSTYTGHFWIRRLALTRCNDSGSDGLAAHPRCMRPTPITSAAAAGSGPLPHTSGIHTPVPRVTGTGKELLRNEVEFRVEDRPMRATGKRPASAVCAASHCFFDVSQAC